MRWYKHDINDFLTGIRQLTLEEIGAYIIIINLAYDREGNLPEDEAYFCRNLSVRPQTWRRLRASLKAKGKIQENSGQTVVKSVVNRLLNSEFTRSLPEVSEKKPNKIKDDCSRARARDSRPQTLDKNKKEIEGTLIDDAWEPNSEHLIVADELKLWIDDHAQEFRDWAKANGKRFHDWDARFKGWLREAHRRLKKSNGGGNGHRKTLAEKGRERIAELQRREHDANRGNQGGDDFDRPILKLVEG